MAPALPAKVPAKMRSRALKGWIARPVVLAHFRYCEPPVQREDAPRLRLLTIPTRTNPCTSTKALTWTTLTLRGGCRPVRAREKVTVDRVAAVTTGRPPTVNEAVYQADGEVAAQISTRQESTSPTPTCLLRADSQYSSDSKLTFHDQRDRAGLTVPGWNPG